jgi:hypothetical protein
LQEENATQRLFKIYTEFDKGKISKKQLAEKIENDAGIVVTDKCRELLKQSENDIKYGELARTLDVVKKG